MPQQGRINDARDDDVGRFGYTQCHLGGRLDLQERRAHAQQASTEIPREPRRGAGNTRTEYDGCPALRGNTTRRWYGNVLGLQCPTTYSTRKSISASVLSDGRKHNDAPYKYSFILILTFR